MSLRGSARGHDWSFDSKRRTSLALAAVLYLLAAASGQGTGTQPVRDRSFDQDLDQLTPLFHGNLTEQMAAARMLAALDPAARVRLLREGLRRTDAPDTAVMAASLLLPEHVDASESERVIELLLPLFFTPGRHGNLDHVRGILGSSDLDRLLGLFPPADESDPTAALHSVRQHVRFIHVPALCRLACVDEPRTRNAAFELLLEAIGYTDAHRDVVARTVLALRPDADAIEGFGDNPHGFTRKHAILEDIPAGELLPQVLRQVFLASRKKIDRRGLVLLEGWAMRWALAQPLDLDEALLEELAASPLALARRTAVRALGMPGSRARPDALALHAAEDANKEHREIATLALGSQARRGNQDALAALERLSLNEALPLAALLEAAPARGAVLLRERVLAADPDAASRTLDILADVIGDDIVATHGMQLPREAFAGFEAAALAAGLPGGRLARIAQEVPGCRTARLAKAALAKLETPAEARLCRELLPFLCMLEVCAPDELRVLLRAWSGSEDSGVRDFALQSLLVLGDAESGVRLLDWIVAGSGIAREPHRSPLPLLGLSGSPELEERLRAMLTLPDLPKGRRQEDALGALAVLHGIPVETGPLFEGDRVALAAWPRIRDLVVAKKPVAALAEYVRGFLGDEDPADVTRIHNLGLVKDPAISQILQAVQERRELGLYSWAVGELAVMGDRVARGEMWSVCQAGRFKWIQRAEPRALTLGLDQKTIPFWIDELESNRARCATAAEIFTRWFGFTGLEWAHGRSETPSARVRRWWSEHGNGLVWSRLADGFVVRVE